VERSQATLRQLEYFVAVAEASSFRRAAERLRVSQPTLTNQILALEQTLGLTLFERSRAGTKPTAATRELLVGARRVLEEAQGFLDQAVAFSRGPAGTYRLGVTPTLGPYLLPHILPHIHRRYTALQLYVREAAPRDLEAGLAAGEHDLILTALPVGEPRLAVVPLIREPLKLVMSAEHPLSDRARIEPRDLAGESVLTLEEHHHFHHQVERLCDRLGARILRDYEGTSLDTLRHMVTMGMGIAFLPALYVRSEIHQPRELRVTNVHGEAIHRTHALAWRAESPARHFFQEIANEIRVVAGRDLADDLQALDRGRDRSTRRPSRPRSHSTHGL
jgi:LysR family hydrogen peroxide-inducible transcriptional activator